MAKLFLPNTDFFIYVKFYKWLLCSLCGNK